jgi:hypothetical protein
VPAKPIVPDLDVGPFSVLGVAGAVSALALRYPGTKIAAMCLAQYLEEHHRAARSHA